MRVPAEVNADIERLLDKLNVDYDPEMVPVAAEEYSTIDSSFDNVEEKVKRDGGQMHYGWNIMTNGYLIEAEYYAVWENNEGTLVDVTPNKPGAAEIMFVSDDTFARNKMVAIPNVRINITDSKLVDDYILLTETFDTILGLTMYIEEDKPWLPEPVINIVRTLDEYRKGVEQLYLHDGKHNGPCHCGANRKYNVCHGRGLKLLTEDIVKRAREMVKMGPEAFRQEENSEQSIEITTP